MCRLRFGTQITIQPNWDMETSEIFAICEIHDSGQPYYVVCVCEEFTDLPIDHATAYVIPSMLSSREVDYVFHMSCAKVEKKDSCSGILYSLTGPEQIFISSIDDCKKLAQEKMNFDEENKTISARPPKLKTGAEIDPPNESGSLWIHSEIKEGIATCDAFNLFRKSLKITEKAYEETIKNTVWN